MTLHSSVICLLRAAFSDIHVMRVQRALNGHLYREVESGKLCSLCQLWGPWVPLHQNILFWSRTSLVLSQYTRIWESVNIWTRQQFHLYLCIMLFLQIFTLRYFHAFDVCIISDFSETNCIFRKRQTVFAFYIKVFAIKPLWASLCGAVKNIRTNKCLKG